eukprot:CAMPEP_0201548662 /NCGR_PEP_ID=MMETSP0173_2-20130828/5193_1 /ASSEMBLY_ACC=CAM_ASM_000268 /TAXON_ID=218659 /ORGANISM="Vexillifera sp., Strain DIVA3 564/2" /LENGTH=60 /DNA_ID=CAMNT_0047958105 /DNA_START=94 /DNA_END=273 /DNA_ORIENTATION=+
MTMGLLLNNSFIVWTFLDQVFVDIFHKFHQHLVLATKVSPTIVPSHHKMVAPSPNAWQNS